LRDDSAPVQATPQGTHPGSSGFFSTIAGQGRRFPGEGGRTGRPACAALLLRPGWGPAEGQGKQSFWWFAPPPTQPEGVSTDQGAAGLAARTWPEGRAQEPPASPQPFRQSPLTNGAVRPGGGFPQPAGHPTSKAKIGEARRSKAGRAGPAFRRAVIKPHQGLVYFNYRPDVVRGKERGNQPSADTFGNPLTPNCRASLMASARVPGPQGRTWIGYLCRLSKAGRFGTGRTCTFISDHQTGTVRRFPAPLPTISKRGRATAVLGGEQNRAGSPSGQWATGTWRKAAASNEGRRLLQTCSVDRTAGA